ncbi:DUF4376 domain-containing protein [Stutzerimonas nitrititolerans]
MKYFRNPQSGEVFAFEADGSQDEFIPSELIPMTPAEIEAHLARQPDDYAAAIAARRWQAEVSGIEIAGMRIETDDRTKTLLNGAALRATIDPQHSRRWKLADGTWVTLDSETLISAAKAVDSYVQACFDREEELVEALADGTFTEAMLEEGWPDGSVPAPAAG